MSEDASLETRVDNLDAKVDRILGMVEKFTGGPPADHATAERQTEDRLDRPSNVAEQVRAELARAEREQATQKAAEQDKSEREQIRETLAKLQETAPEPPQPRRQRVMWGPR